MRRFIVFSLVAVVLLTPFAVLAQEPGEGGLIIEASTRTSANLTSLIPIRCSGVDCSNPGALIFPGLFNVSPETQNYDVNSPVAPDAAFGTDYTVSEDGLTYTVTLRQDWTWSDGTPITAWDVYFTWLAIQQGEAIGLSSSFAPAARDVVGAEVIDDYTIQFTMAEANCQVLSRIGVLGPTPAHAYGWTPDAGEDFDWASMIGHEMDLNPTVTAGPFQFNRLEPGTAIYLEANPTYPYPSNGVGVMPEGYVFLDVADDNVLNERFVAGGEGEPNFVREPNFYAPILDAAERGDVQALSAPGRVWHYVALNTADPNNPMNAYDEEGNLVPREEQGYHPLFGDVRVRQALNHAINIDEIINGPLDGNGTAMVAGTIPSAFTLHPDLERRPFDLDTARQLLDEAGFPATGSPLCSGCDGLRVATEDALYAEPGTEFYFELMNVGDIRNDVAVVIQDQLAQIGIEVEVVVLDFNAMYDDNMGQQTFDAAVAGWRGSLPFDPDQRSFFGSEVDIYGEGYGFNFGSWYNAEFDALGAQVNTIAGCDEQARKEIAWRMQEILYEDPPYIWLYAINSVYGAANNVEGFDPRPNFGNWNSDSWVVRAQ